MGVTGIAGKKRVGKGKKKSMSVLKTQEGWGKWILILSFAVPFLIMLVIFMLKKIYPFGERSFLVSDMYHQYMPFFSEFVRKIKAGEGLAYSYNVGIGSNFLALYGYYLASPLHWLAFLVPGEHLMEFMSYLVIVKIGLCGLTSCICLRNHFGDKQDAGVLFFSCFYAMSGFMAAYNWNIMWLDCVVLLPLIVLGLEQLVKEGKCKLYCITLGLCIFTNFYISIMICIFLVLYFAVLFLWEKCSLKAIRDFALYSLLAGGMAAVLLIPEMFAILETDFGDVNFPDKLESYFSILDVLMRHCMCISTERGLAHWPNIYSGVGTFIMIPMFAMNSGIPARRRFGLLALVGVLLLGFSTNILDFIWHGMNYPDSLPARQSFIYIFLVLVMGYEAYRNLHKEDAKRIVNCYLVAAAFLLFVEKFAQTDHFETWVEFLNLGFVTAYAIVLYLYRTREKRSVKMILALVTLVIVVAESSINMYNTSVGTVSRSAYLDELVDYQKLHETAKAKAMEDEAPFYRMDKFWHKTKNDGTLAGYPTASVFSSTLNSYVMDMYKNLGMLYSKVYYCQEGATFLTNALLNVRFMYGSNSGDEGHLYEHLGDSGEVSLYEAQVTLPFGYVAPEGFDLPSGSNGLQVQNQLVKNLGVKGTLFTKVDSQQDGDNVIFTADEDAYYYGILTASGTREVDFSAPGVARYFNDLKNTRIMHLGFLKAGTDGKMINGDKNDESKKIKADVYKMDEGVLREAIDILSRESMANVFYDSTHINGEITLAEGGRLILSVPYEKGWTVMVDGVETKPALFGGTLMALDLKAGHHIIEMHYVPYGKNLGILVSMVSIAIFVTIVVWGRGIRKKSAA
ncbi:MAG: YfhO family protein [Lachnospiraceae bacterium]|nr:YfhO family protein [Lachnospiraceae bacterium]